MSLEVCASVQGCDDGLDRPGIQGLDLGGFLLIVSGMILIEAYPDGKSDGFDENDEIARSYLMADFDQAPWKGMLVKVG